jgi:hypothetical protein
VDKSEFPIFLEHADYEKKKARLLRAPESALKLFDDFQLWKRPENARTTDPLWIIHSLHNYDKHRGVHLTVCAHRSLGIIVPMRDGTAIHVTPEPIVLATQPVTIPLPGNPSHFADNINVHITGRTVLFFGGQPHLAELPVSDILHNCVRHIEDRSFRPFASSFREMCEELAPHLTRATSTRHDVPESDRLHRTSLTCRAYN